jgi:hypothetical protein
MNFRYYKSKSLIVFVIILSILYSFLAEYIDHLLPTDSTFRNIWKYIDLFSTVSLLYLTMLFIDEIGWKLKMFKWLVDVPNLNGRYEGTLESTYQTGGANTKKICAMEIKQTASKIKIFSYYGDPGANNQTSIAYSHSEEIIQEEDGFFNVHHIFSGEPDTLEIQLNNHYGASYMKYFPDIKMLDGSYFNERTNKGTFRVTFMQNKLLGRLRQNP